MIISPQQQMILNQLVQAPEGQALALSVTIAGEEGDEGFTYEDVIGFLDDPRLISLAVRHHEDEQRHSLQFRDCLSRLGLEYLELPEDLKMIQCIRNNTGDYYNGIKTAEDMVKVCAMTHIVEQRGIARYGAWAKAFDSVDPKTAEVYRQVVQEEGYHLEVCEKIGLHYSNSENDWREALKKADRDETNAMKDFGNVAFGYFMMLKANNTPA